MLYVTVSAPREPTYKGKPLSKWVERHASGNTAEREEATQAIRHIGTNAVPYLMAEIQKPIPTWRVTLFVMAEAFRANPNPRRLFDVVSRSAYAGEALSELGPEASSAIPELTRLANDRTSYAKAATAMGVLAHLGNQGFPPLFALLTSRDPKFRDDAASAMRFQGTNARPAIPLLLQGLSNVSSEVTAAIAAETLGELALDADLVVPALSNALHHPRENTRWTTVYALAGFRDDPRTAPAIAIALSDADPDVRKATTNTLRRIAPEYLTNAPAK